jgi:hypothetical protein
VVLIIRKRLVLDAGEQPEISVYLSTILPRNYVRSYEVQRKREVCTSLSPSHA